MDSKTNETYVPLSRGLDEHLSDLSGNALKIYLHLLINAKFRGKDKGKFAATFEDIALALRMHRITVWKACQKLKPKYIDYKAGSNQFDINIFTIQKYKAIEDFETLHKFKKEVGVSPDANSKDKSAVSEETNSKDKVGVSPRETASKRRGNTNFGKSNKDKEKQKRNNVNNVKNVFKENFSSEKGFNEVLSKAVKEKKKEIGL